MKKEEKLDNIKEILLKNLKLDAIILFGSYARNRERIDSDIDIAIKPKCDIPKETLIEIQEEIEEKIDTDIHLINLDVIEDDFRYDILITGQELYVENEMCFIEYKLAAFNKYLDLNEDRQIIINKIKEGGTLYGEWISYT
mgnify:FL=1